MQSRKIVALRAEIDMWRNRLSIPRSLRAQRGNLNYTIVNSQLAGPEDLIEFAKLIT